MKCIFITGGSGFVGLKIIDYFIKRDFVILTTVNSQSGKKKIVKSFDTYVKKKKIQIIISDFREDKFENKILQFIKKTKQYPNILINNARNVDNLILKKKNAISDKQWFTEFKISVIASYNLAEMMIKNFRGKLERVINISSIYGTVAINQNLQKYNSIPTPIHYSVCKSALIHLTKEFASKHGDKGITFNTVSFGGIKNNQNKNFIKEYSRLVPSKKMLDINDVIEPIKFLLSSGSNSINGHNLIVDGGWTIW
jgi:NAD(P)-dependent dehydrogenase (short-subunit alcohol dehydrogenase family)